MKEGGFETGERKIERIGEWVRESKTMRITRFSELGNSRATRIRKAENFGDFIEAFTDGIVTGRGDDFEMIVMFHADDLSMAAGNNESKERKFRFFGEPVGINMGLKVMHWIEGDVMQNADSASGESAN